MSDLPKRDLEQSPLSDEEIKQKVLSTSNIQDTYKHNTEIVTLPSRGLLYSEDNILSKGNVEMKYMTAKEEDILSSKNLLSKGLAIERLLSSLIVTPLNLNDLLQTDYDALMIASRILGYGSKYTFQIEDPDSTSSEKQELTVDLNDLQDIEPDWMKDGKRDNIFTCTLPITNSTVEFRLLTVGDIKQLDKEAKERIQLERRNNQRKGRDIEPSDYLITSRLAHMIVSINGNKDRQDIKKFVDNLPVRDAKYLRDEYKKQTPTLDLTIGYTSETSGKYYEMKLPIGQEFFWPTTI